MRGSERSEPVAGPLENLSQMYFGQLDKVLKGYEPVTKGLVRYNLEVSGLAAKRARAWFDIPSQVRACRSPQDLVAAQMRFWQTAATQYTESWQRMGNAIGALAEMPGLRGSTETKAAPLPRDYITFPEPQEPVEAVKPRSSDRLVA